MSQGHTNPTMDVTEEQPKSPNIAHRPHTITWILGICAILTSGLSAYFSYRALTTNRDAIELGNRPWIVIQNATQIEKFEPSKKSTITITFKNEGKTPAMSLEVDSAIAFAPLNGKEPDFAAALEEDPPPFSENAVGPSAVGTRSHLVEDIDAKGHQLQKVADGKLRIFYVGVITYKDVFQGNRFTRWCFEYSIDHDHSLKQNVCRGWNSMM